MKHIIAIALAFAALATSAEARERFHGPALCGVSFEAHGGGLQILIGHFRLHGHGVIECEDMRGNKTRMPVEIQFGGRSPLALKLAAGHLRLHGVATGAGYARGPEELLGDYLVLGADAAVGLGAGADLSFHAKREALTLNVNAQVEQGLGVNVGFQSLTIREAR